MAKQQRIHIAIDEKSKGVLEQYMDKNNCSQAQAGKALLEMGANFWLRSLEDDKGSNIMDILEEILKSCYEINTFQQLCAVKEIEKQRDPTGKAFNLEVIKNLSKESAIKKKEAVL